MNNETIVKKFLQKHLKTEIVESNEDKQGQYHVATQTITSSMADFR